MAPDDPDVLAELQRVITVADDNRRADAHLLCPICDREGCEEHIPVQPLPDAPLTFHTMRELAARIRAAGPRRYLLRGWWPSVDYGVLSAEAKGQKTWTGFDMAVSVASGTPWLGHVAVDQPGPVLIFLGEGSEANALRRLVALANARGLDAEDLPIVVCTRAPHFQDPVHLGLVEDKVQELQPVLTIVDPLYLAARGAKLGDLYAMGELLEQVQHVCQRHGSALLVVHHHNRKDGSGAGRMSGAGPAEWGRVLLTLDVKSRNTDPATTETTVITELRGIGGEITDQALRIVRRIQAVDPDSLDSPLLVSTTVEVAEDGTTAPTADSLKPAARKLLEALQAHPSGATPTALVDHIVKHHGHGLVRETVSKTLTDLARRGLARSIDNGQFQPKIWRPCDPCDVTRDLTPDSHRVTACDFPREVTRRSHTAEITRDTEDAKSHERTTL